MPGVPTLPPILLALLLTGGAPPIPPAPTPAPAPPSAALLLADFERAPRVVVSWTTGAGEEVRLEGERPYSGDKDRAPLGLNIDCFVAVGGTRLSKGAGHPEGIIVRVGFYKRDPLRPFFDGIAADGRIRVELSGVRFNHAAAATPESVLQHLKFAPEQLEVCSLPTDARDQYNTASAADTLNERIRPGIDARLGALDASAPDHGSATITTQSDASLTLVCEFPYALLRHLQDPWRSGVPGTFVEPVHFHIEFEAMPPETLARIESGRETWPPPSRRLDDTPDQRPPDLDESDEPSGDD